MSTAFWTGIAGAMFGLTRAFRADEPPPRGATLDRAELFVD